MEKGFDFHTHKLVKNALCDVGTPDSLPVGDDFQFSVGIHPWVVDTQTDLESRWVRVLELTEDERVSAIGETGLDLVHHESANIEKQLFWFEKHIKLAEEIEVPVIIHCVRQNEKILELRKKMRPKQPWILHGYTHSLAFAQELQKFNIMISIGELFLNGKHAHELAQFPDFPFFIETDDSSTPIEALYEKANSFMSQ